MTVIKIRWYQTQLFETIEEDTASATTPDTNTTFKLSTTNQECVGYVGA